MSDQKIKDGAYNITVSGWKKPKVLFLKAFEKEKPIRETVVDAARSYTNLMGTAPVYAFVKYLPAGVENCEEVQVDDYAVMLIAAEWMRDGYAAVGGSHG